jgi:hypothetical protein
MINDTWCCRATLYFAHRSKLITLCLEISQTEILASPVGATMTSQMSRRGIEREWSRLGRNKAVERQYLGGQWSCCQRLGSRGCIGVQVWNRHLVWAFKQTPLTRIDPQWVGSITWCLFQVIHVSGCLGLRTDEQFHSCRPASRGDVPGSPATICQRLPQLCFAMLSSWRLGISTLTTNKPSR